MRTKVGLIVSCAVVAVGGGIVAHASGVVATTEPVAGPASPQGDSQVIAQGMVDFPDGQFAWRAQQQRAEQVGTDVDAPGTQFILADEGSIVVATGEESRVLLAPGEAEFDPVTLPANVMALEPAGAGYWSIMLMSDGVEASATPIEPGAGVRDVNLVRDVLAPGEFMSLASDHPAFVLVTSGQLAVGGGVGQMLAAGASATVPGVGLLTNQGTEPAIVVVALIGDLLTPRPGTSTTATTGVSTTVQTSTSAPSTTTPATLPVTTLPVTTLPGPVTDIPVTTTTTMPGPVTDIPATTTTTTTTATEP